MDKRIATSDKLALRFVSPVGLTVNELNMECYVERNHLTTLTYTHARFILTAKRFEVMEAGVE